jgi:hypothetical protein
MIKWFAANNLVLNLDKMNIMKFITKNSSHSTLHIGYKEKYIEERESSQHSSSGTITAPSAVFWMKVIWRPLLARVNDGNHAAYLSALKDFVNT